MMHSETLEIKGVTELQSYHLHHFLAWNADAFRAVFVNNMKNSEIIVKK